MSSVIEKIERAQLRRVPSFSPGDRVKVHFQVVEGSRSRVQVFEGVVIKRQGHGARETFTVRKQSFGVGVERMFPVHSPKIERIELAARGDVRRAKLYYLRERVGKRARVRERRYTGPETVVEPGLLHAVEEQAQAPEAAGRRGAPGRPRRARRRRPRPSRRRPIRQTSRLRRRKARTLAAMAASRGGRRSKRAATVRARRPPMRRLRRRMTLIPPPMQARAWPPPPVTTQREHCTERPQTLQIPDQLDRRAGRDRGRRAGSGACHPGLHRQALQDPERLDGTHARDRPAGAREPHRDGLRQPQRGPDRGVPSPRRRRERALRQVDGPRRSVLAAGREEGRA